MGVFKCVTLKITEPAAHQAPCEYCGPERVFSFYPIFFYKKIVIHKRFINEIQ